MANERNRLARELHDVIGHTLTASSAQLDGASQLVEPEPQRATTRMIETARGHSPPG